jgi:hypothetical protein
VSLFCNYPCTVYSIHEEEALEDENKNSKEDRSWEAFYESRSSVFPLSRSSRPAMQSSRVAEFCSSTASCVPSVIREKGAKRKRESSGVQVAKTAKGAADAVDLFII